MPLVQYLPAMVDRDPERDAQPVWDVPSENRGTYECLSCGETLHADSYPVSCPECGEMLRNVGTPIE